MSVDCNESTFEPINRGYNAVFRPGRMSIGLVVPIENYERGPVPTMKHYVRRI